MAKSRLRSSRGKGLLVRSRLETSAKVVGKRSPGVAQVLPIGASSGPSLGEGEVLLVVSGWS